MIRKAWQQIIRPAAEPPQGMGEGRPFYSFLTILLVVVSILSVNRSTTLQSPPLLIIFIFIMSVHIGLHWLSPFHFLVQPMAAVYLTIQGMLGMAAVILSGSPGLSLAIFAAMIGETIGTYGTTRKTAIAVLAYTLLTPIGYLFVGGVETFQGWLSPTISTLFILIIFMVLFRRQLDASFQARTLAGELEAANRQLAEYAAQVEDLTLAAERQRMARELHDTLAQGVAGLVLQLEAVKAHLEADRSQRAGEIIEQALSRARSTLAESRAVIDNLRAAPADLPEAVLAKVERFTQATGIPCGMDIALGETSYPPNINDHLLRILSEALANITRYARAGQVTVSLRNSEKALSLAICDDGIGFDPETAERPGHYGLLGMRERARLLEGELTIETSTGNGTCIKLTIPHARGNIT